MKRSIYTFAFVLVLVTMNSCSNFQNKVRGLLSSKPASSSTQVSHPEKTGYYILADGTYSTFQDYTVPKLKISFLKILIDRLRTKNGGAIWVSYIDNNCKNNQTLFILVPKPLHTKSKTNFMAKGAIHFQQEKKDWEIHHAQEVADSANEMKTFVQKEQEFLQKAKTLLQTKVYVKSYRNQMSDVTGSVRSAIQTLHEAKENQIVQNCTIIGFSDFQNDPPDSTLKPDPSIRVYNLISQPGKAKNSVPGSHEISDVDYLLSILKP